MIRMLKQNKLLKVLSLNSFSVGVSFVLGIASTKIVSMFLGATGMALLGSFRNLSTMTRSIATLGINNSLVKLIVENKKDEKELSIIYSTFFWFFLMISALLSLSVLVFANSISEFLFFTNSYSTAIRFYGLVLPLVVINTFWIAIYNGWEKYKKIVVIQLVSNVLIFLFTSLLIYKKQILGAFLSISIGELLAVLVTFLFIRNDKSYFSFSLQRIIDKKYLDVIKKFSSMALLTAVLTPLTLILIRNLIVKEESLANAGIWEAVNRLSGFYMLFFSSGLSMYYLPKLASLNTEVEFVSELKSYFKVFVPLFFFSMVFIYLFRSIILQVCFSKEFSIIEDILIWQLLGDFMRVLTLSFGYQILVKAMVKKYVIIELAFNGSYLLLSIYLMQLFSTEGVLKAYFFANLISLSLVLFMFRNIVFKFK